MNRVEVGGRLFLFVSGFDTNIYLTSGYRIVGQDDNGVYAKDVRVNRSLQRKDNIHYWGKVVNGYNEAYKDDDNYFINASYTPKSTAQLRYKEGEEAGQNIVAKLASGEIKMSEGETIKTQILNLIRFKSGWIEHLNDKY